MNGLTSVTTKGQVTIPEPLRQILGIKPGDKARFTLDTSDKKQMVVNMIPKNVVDRLAGSLKTNVKETNWKKVRHQAGLLLAKKYGLK